MEIVNIRVDSRLIHGQVAAMWSGTLNATRIMIVGDDIVQDVMMKNLLKMACPKTCKLSILDVATAVHNVQIQKYTDDRIFVIVKDTKTLVQMADQGFPMSEVTIGNINGRPGSRAIRKTVCVTKEDEADLHHLADKGIMVYTQMVPADAKEDLMKLL